MASDLATRAQRAAAVSLVSTTIVVAVKLVAAWKSHSISVLSEGLQSTVDILMSALAVMTVRYAARPADAGHPYGHGKAEVLSSAFQMVVILGSGAFILWAAYLRLLHPQPILWDWGAAAMGYTVVVNLAISAYLLRVAKGSPSAALESEALHLKSDTLTSLGVLVGMVLVGATGEMILDPVVAAVFTLAAMGAAAKRLPGLLHPLLDGALPKEEVARLETILNEHKEVCGYHNLRTRMVGNLRFVDLHVMLHDQLSFVRAHELAEEIEAELKRALKNATVSIHYEPFEAEVEHRKREHVG